MENKILENKIISRLNVEIKDSLYGKSYEVFSECVEVILGSNVVKPDIFVVCRDKGNETSLQIPTLIFEVVSPSNANIDTITKMKLYAKFGIKEYSLVYQEGTIQQYRLNEYGEYYLETFYRSEEMYRSIAIEYLQVDLMKVFK